MVIVANKKSIIQFVKQILPIREIVRKKKQKNDTIISLIVGYTLLFFHLTIEIYKENKKNLQILEKNSAKSK